MVLHHVQTAQTAIAVLFLVLFLGSIYVKVFLSLARAIGLLPRPGKAKTPARTGPKPVLVLKAQPHQLLPLPKIPC